MIDDLRFAIRVLREHPAFSSAAIVSLALGIAVNVVMFSVFDAVLLRPLPIAEPERVLRIGATVDGSGFFGLSHAEFADLRVGADVWEAIVAYRFNSVVVNAGDGPAEAAAEFVSTDYLSALGVTPIVGRGFLPDDQTPGADPVVVISDRLWELRFARDSGIIGRQVTVGGRPATVVGVAPAGFAGTFPGVSIRLWVPLAHNDRLLPGRGTLEDPEDRFLLVLGRLHDGVERSEARAQLAALAVRVWPPGGGHDRWGLDVRSAAGVIPIVAGFARPFMMLLMGAVALVLVIACANVAGLLLVRGHERTREMALRAAIGASRARLVRQLMGESLVLATMGGLLGVILSGVGLAVVTRYQPGVGGVSVQFNPGLDLRVLTFAFAVTAMTGLMFGIVPAFRVASQDLAIAIREGQGTGGRKSSSLRAMLVIAQVAISTVLLIGSGLLVRGLNAASQIAPGFDPKGTVVASLSPQLVGYGEEETRSLWLDLEERLDALPGVDRIAWGRYVPLGGQSDQVEMIVSPSEPDGRRSRINYNVIDSRYLALLSIPIVRGRNFSSGDGVAAPQVAIVNATLAVRLGGDEDVIGGSLRVWDREGVERVVEIVGVAGDIKYRRLSEDPTPLLYVPSDQWFTPEMQMHVRGPAGTTATVGRVITVVRAVDRNLPVAAVPMTEVMASSLVPTRIAGVVLGVTGSVALLLATTGLFAIVSYTAVRRLHEMGIRLALGASAGSVGRLVLWQGLRLTGSGLVIGCFMGFLLARLLRGLLVGVSPADPVTFVATAAVLAMAGALACVFPASRVRRADPVGVMRSE